MAKLTAVQSDLSREREGVWCHYMQGWECKLARQGNDEFLRAKRRIQQDPQLRIAATGELSEEETRKVMAPYVAEFIVRDWRGLEGDDGTAIPYSIEKATELLLMPEMHHWYTWVLEQSRSQRLFLRDFEGNSSESA